MTQKIVVQKSYGGFQLSGECLAAYLAVRGKRVEVQKEEGGYLYYLPETNNYFDAGELNRDDPDLIAIVLAEQEAGRCQELKIIEIPDDVKWQIDDYDGFEWVAECHRVWR